MTPRTTTSPGPRRGRWRSLAAVAGVGTLAFALASCGIPSSKSASPIPTSAIPERVVAPNPPPTSPATQSGLVKMDIYFTTTQIFVVPVPRYLPPHASLTTVIATLLAGPSSAERAKGIDTALGPSVLLVSSHAAGNVVTVNFGGAFGQLSGFQEVLGVAQVVFTVAAVLSPSTGVLFEIDDVPLDVPLSNGALVAGPVRLEDYTTLLAPNVTTSTPHTSPPPATSGAGTTTTTQAPATTTRPTGARPTATLPRSRRPATSAGLSR